ncbi:phytanoyl-CoA dioxygenase family protein [Pseudomonas abietaniphila]|uniref:Ectoine hydroxylase-related dioxygenase, phytanoyl-CoA dioxygenase (PhyH) family n=1 Tax=Pseudomonas abietaniphila TaxID=89065 RepID=A0A1G7T0W3_9PSED|nr:phytanoyl-CoA dioxygenase family protein [Pseudomonas abietaniphila]SDG28289.1 Ectoine hydroxylase-related dioxygenase, phytanoyl-CoA dioxygenase (PhyH) family [Pseudomonas abietaniphila]
MSLFATSRDIDVRAFAAVCEQRVNAAEYPHAQEVVSQVVIYDADALRSAALHDRLGILSELHRLFRDGPGVMVVRNAFPDLAVVDRHSEVFRQIITDEAARVVRADHFAKAGANQRIWNSLQKAAEHSPDSFIEYYANPLLGLIAESWLGPYFQATAQVNVVTPGGQAQQPHRDYHLGFQSDEVAARFPLPMHRLSQHLTLQGAVAHTDMPLETGPTLLLPFSQQYELGYLAWRDQAFIDYFDRHAIQLPLNKGDLLFFNPALFHAAGTNRTTDEFRMANLLQISSAFGKPMETVNRERMMLALYPLMLKRVEQGELDEEGMQAVIAMSADGYSFPTNLDTDPPLHGMAPQTGQQLFELALQERWPVERFVEAVEVMRVKRLA